MELPACNIWVILLRKKADVQEKTSSQRLQVLSGLIVLKGDSPQAASMLVSYRRRLETFSFGPSAESLTSSENYSSGLPCAFAILPQTTFMNTILSYNTVK